MTIDDDGGPPIGCFHDDTIAQLKRDGFYVLNGIRILYETDEALAARDREYREYVATRG